MFSHRDCSSSHLASPAQQSCALKPSSTRTTSCSKCLPSICLVLFIQIGRDCSNGLAFFYSKITLIAAVATQVSASRHREIIELNQKGNEMAVMDEWHQEYGRNVQLSCVGVRWARFSLIYGNIILRKHRKHGHLIKGDGHWLCEKQPEYFVNGYLYLNKWNIIIITMIFSNRI